MHKTIMSTLVVGGLLCANATADANTLLAEWTFEVSIPTTAGPHAAEGGEVGGEALGFHLSEATVWSNPVGNGSSESFSSNNWSEGDYYQFSTSTLGFENIEFGWSQTRSGTGPADFVAQWSADGETFEDLLAYEVLQISWSSNPDNFQPDSVFGPIALPEAANGLETVWVRLVSQQTTAAAGTNRIDDVFFVSVREGGKKPDPCVGDLDGDGVVDGADLGSLLNAWGTDNAAADLNGDGVVDGADLGILLNNWGKCPNGA